MASDAKDCIGLVGACGRMGRSVALKLWESGFLLLPIEAPSHPAQGKDYGVACKMSPSGVTVTTVADPAFASCRAVVDFSSPEGFRQAIENALAFGIPFLSGTTGITEEEHSLMADAARRIPIFYSANMSYGVAVLSDILLHLARLTADMAVSIIEVHHSRKKDAPSGTALRFGEIVKTARGKDDIAIHSVRAGDVVGEHTITFFGDGERIELTHRAHTRDLFAAGALHALRWLLDRKGPGLYSMSDVVRDTAQ